MARTEELARTMVTSPDGTRIACFSAGDGPPLVLVHGTTADHSRWATILPYLEPQVTVYAIDRRGRGASGDAAEYDVEREYEDVAAVVDAVANETRTPVDLLGHSFGGQCAFGAALRTSNVRRLVLYEGWPAPNPKAVTVPAEVEQRMGALLATGDRQGMLETMMRELVKMPEHELSHYRTLPAWQARIAAAHTIPRELNQLSALDVAEAARIVVPVLLLVGSDTPAESYDAEDLATALPDARISVLDGQQHIAMDMVPELFAQRILDFLKR